MEQGHGRAGRASTTATPANGDTQRCRLAVASLMKVIAKFCSGLTQFLFVQTSRPEPFVDTGSEMSAWHAHRQRQKAEAIEAEAEGMVHDFGVDAFPKRAEGNSRPAPTRVCGTGNLSRWQSPGKRQGGADSDTKRIRLYRIRRRLSGWRREAAPTSETLGKATLRPGLRLGDMPVRRSRSSRRRSLGKDDIVLSLTVSTVALAAGLARKRVRQKSRRGLDKDRTRYILVASSKGRRLTKVEKVEISQ